MRYSSWTLRKQYILKLLLPENPWKIRSPGEYYGVRRQTHEPYLQRGIHQARPNTQHSTAILNRAVKRKLRRDIVKRQLPNVHQFLQPLKSA